MSYLDMVRQELELVDSLPADWRRLIHEHGLKLPCLLRANGLTPRQATKAIDEFIAAVMEEKLG